MLNTLLAHHLLSHPLPQDNELKFSMVVSGWEFKDETNKLRYGLTIKDKSKGKDGTDGAKKTKDGELDFDGGNLLYPSTGVITGVSGAADRSIEVFTTYTNDKGKNELDFLFGSFDKTETLYYDPTLGTSSSSALKVGLAAAAAGVIGAVTLMF